MSLFDEYLATVALLGDDLGSLQTVSGDVSDALDAVDDFLGIPATIASALNSAKSVVTFSSAEQSVLNVLDNLDIFGIGTAVDAFDAAADALAASIGSSASAMTTIDNKLDPVRDLVDDGRDVIATVSITISIAETAFTVVEDEAARLEASLSDQMLIAAGSFTVLAKVNGFIAATDDYIALRDTVLTQISGFAAQAEAAAMALADALPDPSIATNLASDLSSFFDPITGFLTDFESLLDGISLFGVSALDVLEAVGSFADFIVDGIVELVDLALAPFGLSLGGVDNLINDAIADLLAPFNPIQQAVNDLNAVFDSLLADLTAPLTQAVGDLVDLVQSLQDAVDLGILFENSVVGDEAPDLERFADTLSGTDGVEDAIYGLRGADILTGGDDDFVFGGNGRDTINAEGARVEAYGGAGNDRITVTGENGSFRADGGAGNDILIGGAQSDTFFGNLGDDTMIGRGGTDIFYFTGEGGNDTVIGGFAALSDAYFIDTDLTGGDALSMMEFVQGYTEVLEGDTVVTFDNGSTVTFAGLDRPALIYNAIIFDSGLDAVLV